jgi:adenylate kinase
MTALNVIMLGPPGAGKGTQAAWLSRDFDIPKISTGDILREAVTQGTELGRLIRSTMETGQLVPDAAVVGIVRERLDRPDAVRGFILDGFPRTVVQARALDDLMRRRSPLTVLLVEVPFEELVRRLQARRVCGRCGKNADPGLPDGIRCSRCGGMYVTRVDDSDGVVRQRLTVYLEETEPLVTFYDGRPTFFRINGNLPPAAVTSQVRDALAKTRALLDGGAAMDAAS